ncbi:MAG TPA: ATP-binding cassette domain-containing protein [Woeseiaceae bacterium]|nr:ATP-binding cassette domain-containing protein [Woeseiaceae bacterium]
MTQLILDGVSLRIRGRPLFAPLGITANAGTVTSITGPSGAGKSSLLAYVCGTLATEFEAEGRVLLDAADVTNLPPERRGIGILFQDPLLFPHLSVRGNLLFGLKSGGSRRQRHARVDAELKTMGLAGFGERDPASLSGGQKARVALLRVLLAEPRALLLDEPFGTLDTGTRHKVRALVFAEVQRRNLPALLVTHDKQDIAASNGETISIVPL